MKQVILMMALTLMTSVALSKEVCEVKMSDIGTIVGVGSSSSEAFEDAATKCYDKRAQIHRSRFGRHLGEDDGLAIIDICANVRCS